MHFRCVYILFFLTLAIFTESAAQTSLFSTQLNLSMGATRVAKGDYPQTGFSTSVKEMYLVTGAIYIEGGFCTSFLNSLQKTDGVYHAHQATLLTAPVGVGFYMGDDRLYLNFGVDFLTGIYTNTPKEIPDPRQWVIGYMPEFGFSLKVGRYHKRGFGLGMMGRILLIQSADSGESNNPHVGFAGVGIVFRF